jgi:hypothetical protein
MVCEWQKKLQPRNTPNTQKEIFKSVRAFRVFRGVNYGVSRNAERRPDLMPIIFHRAKTVLGAPY